MMDKKQLLEKAKEEAEAECQRAENVCTEFERKNGQKPSVKEKKQIQGRPERMVSVVVDMKTNIVYTATSGRPPSIENFHNLLRRNMPDPSLEPWSPQTCAEVQAADKALKSRSDAQISDFIIATVRSVNGNPKERCENCKITLKDAIVITDEIAEKEIEDVQI